MSWGKHDPEKDGWYLVTLNNGTVMPMRRMEYPKGNFTWQGVSCGLEVIASIKFPKAYRHGGKTT